MSIEIATGALLIAVPIAFNLAFFELGRTFDYPGILREPADVILRRFAAGGTPLLLRWQALLLSSLAMLPLVALLASVLDASQGIDDRERGHRFGSRPGPVPGPRPMAIRRAGAGTPIRCGGSAG